MTDYRLACRWMGLPKGCMEDYQGPYLAPGPRFWSCYSITTERIEWFSNRREVIPVLTVVGSHANEVIGVNIVNNGCLIASFLCVQNLKAKQSDCYKKNLQKTLTPHFSGLHILHILKLSKSHLSHTTLMMQNGHRYYLQGVHLNGWIHGWWTPGWHNSKECKSMMHT